MKETRQKNIFRKIHSGIAPSLPRPEICAYSCIWVYALYISMEKVYIMASDYKPFYSPGYFTEGWSFLGREKDASDMEWNVWSEKYISFIPWIIIHIAISQFLLLKYLQSISYFYILFSSLSMAYVIGILPTLYLFLQALIIFPTYLFKSRIICWTVGLTVLVFLNINPFTQLLEFIVLPYSNEEYIMSIVTAWLIIRGLSFSLHRCCESRKSKTIQQDLIHYLGFCFYFPLLYTGPLMMFNDFEKQLLASKPKWDKRKLSYHIANLLRYIFWFLFNELTLHYFYVHIFRLHLNLLTHCPRLVLNGVGYSVSQFFMNKYTVLYGLPGAIAQLEHYDPPPKPKCVARIYMYSDMWRYFDRGLYTFFTKYIYIPILGINSTTFKKLIGMTLCFTFVYVWHGATYTNFVWAFLNYIEVSLEMIASAVVKNERVAKFQVRWITPCWSRRLHALFSVPLLYLGCISNFYFLVGYEATNIMIDRLILNAPFDYFLCQSFCLYCMCQVSIEVKNWEMRKLKSTKNTN